MYIVNDDIPLGCIYEGENGKTKYCPMLNHDDHDDFPYCQYLEDDEAAIGIDERPVYCPIVEFPYADVPDTNVGDMISRQAAIDDLQGKDPSQIWDTADIEVWVNALPSADAVEVVRCKDCLMHGVCRFERGLGLDGYCSQAERREDG